MFVFDLKRVMQFSLAEVHLILLSTMGKFMYPDRLYKHLTVAYPCKNSQLNINFMLFFLLQFRPTMLTFSLDLVWVWSSLEQSVCTMICFWQPVSIGNLIHNYIYRYIPSVKTFHIIFFTENLKLECL